MVEKATLEQEQETVGHAAAEQAVIEFDYDAAAELFPSRRQKSRRRPIGYRRLATRRTPSGSQSRSFLLSFSWELVSKSTRRDITIRQFATCTTAWTIP